MILYFSGTGNSEYVARQIGKELDDSVIDLFEKLREQDFSVLTSDKPWIIVVPTYAWQIPHIVRDWVLRTELNGNPAVYFVMTCGGSIGNAGAYCEKLCRAKHMHYQGCMEIVMPENYIALFTAPQQEQALSIIRNASGKIAQTARHIREGRPFPQREASLQDKVNSSVVNLIFYPALVHAKKFYATDRCVSCGKCAKVCPLNNIQLANGKPVWGRSCTHCMACICRCPTEAIEYGAHTKGMVRYTFPQSH